MSLTKEAIDRIAQLGAAGCIGDDTSLLMVPSGVSVTDVSKYAAKPRFHKSAVNTNCIKTFARWTRDNEKASSRIFIDPEKMEAKAIYDYGTSEEPEHKNQIAHIEIKSTPIWNTIQHLDGKALSQDQAAEFIEDWADHISAIALLGDKTEPEEINPTKASQAMRKLKFNVNGSSESQADQLAQKTSTYSHIQNAGEIRVSTLIIKAELHDGLPNNEVVLRVSYNAGEKPTVCYRIVRKTSLVQTEAESFASELQAAIKTEAGNDSEITKHIYLGEFW